MSSVDPGDKPQAVWLSDDGEREASPESIWLSNTPEYDDDAFADPTWNTVDRAVDDPGQVFDHKRAAVWLEQRGQHRSATTIRRHGIRLEANRRVEAIRGRSLAPIMLEAEQRVAQIVATPRERRPSAKRRTASRASPDDPSEPEPVAFLRGFTAASERLSRHLQRRSAARRVLA